MASQFQLPPWLNISPSDFTQAAIAGGEQGYRAAAEAGSLAQRGLLSAAQLAQEAASRAAEIRVRREQINAELARNAANVAAARYNAALDFNQAQAALQFAREREANAVAQQGVENQLNRDALEAETGVEMAKLNAPQSYAPTDDERNLAAIDRLESEGKTEEAAMLRNIIIKRGETTEKPVPLAADVKAEIDALSKRAAELSLKQRSEGLSEEDTGERSRIMKRLRQLQGASQITTNAPAAPASPVGAPMRYQLINGQLQLVR